MGKAVDRYGKFLTLIKGNGYRNHFFVPSYDIDFCWHTHMLLGTQKYLRDTLEMAGDEVDHDDSVNQREPGSKLNNSWAETKSLWKEKFPNDVNIHKKNAGYRGEPPDWWSETDAKKIVKIADNVLDSSRIEALIDRINPNDIVSTKTWTEPNIQFKVEVDSCVRADIEAITGGELPNHCVSGRVCKSSVPMHKDRFNGDGDFVEGWVYLLYLQSNGVMILKDDVSNELLHIDAKPGTMVSFPNSRFSHCYDATNENGALRIMLGPIALDPKTEEITYSGGCGGCGGCGGGGSCGGGGGCGGGCGTGS